MERDIQDEPLTKEEWAALKRGETWRDVANPPKPAIEPAANPRPHVEREEKTKLYVVQAYRFGDAQRHSYVVGIFDSREEAVSLADKEETDRGGKYYCEVSERTLNTPIHLETGTIIRALVNHSPSVTHPLGQSERILRGITNG